MAAESSDPASLLNLYRGLLALRRSSPALRDGALTLLAGLPPGVLAWTREAGGERLLVIANMGDDPATASVSSVAQRGELLAGTGAREGSIGLDEVRLDPLEGLLLRL